MRVRLSYSVELDDVPDSVAELIESELFRIEDAKEKIGKAHNVLCQEEPHLDLAIKSLQGARYIVESIEMRLNECESMLQGYKEAIDPSQELAEEPAVEQQFDGDYNTPYEVPKESQK